MIRVRFIVQSTCYNDYRIAKRHKDLFAADISAEQKAGVAFCIYIIATEIGKFHSRNLFANQRFAVEIQEFRLPIVVIMNTSKQKGR